MGCSINFPPLPVTCDGCENKPHIGENGNWYVGNMDTGVKAQGPPGQDAEGKYIILASDCGKVSNVTLADNHKISEFKFLSLSLSNEVSHIGTCLGCIIIPTSLFCRYKDGVVARTYIKGQDIYAQCKYVDNTTVYIGANMTGYSGMLCGIS